MTSQPLTATETTREIIRHLWRRRFIIIAVPIVAFAVAYLYIRYQVPETYEASAMLYVRERTSGLQNRYEQGFTKIEPPSYEVILRNDELLREVVQAAREKFPDRFPQSKFERIKKAFQIDVIATHDTTVTTSYSPAIWLLVEADHPEIAQFLAQTWMELSIEHFGQLTFREAEAYVRAISERADTISAEIASQTRIESSLKQEVYELESMLRSHVQLLAGETGARMRDRQHRDDLVESSSARVNADTTVKLYNSEAPQGLLEQKAMVELGMASGDDPNGSAKLAKITELIASTEAEIDALRDELAGKESELAAVQASLNAQHAALEGVERTINYAAADQALVADPSNPEIQGDLRILARPVMPEVRVRPSRTLIAGAITVAISIFLLFMLIAEHQLRLAISDK